MGINVLSLFDGLSCGRIALERAGIEVDNYYSSEIDKYAIQIANKNYPQDEVNRLGDITKITEEQLSSLPKIDLLIGGSPCQGFSMSGKRKGSSTKEGVDIVSLKQYLKLKDEGVEFDGQSFLFWEYVRILKIAKPKYFLLENVRVSNKWIDMFNKSMGVKPIYINSNLVSAQNRPRFYWTNIPNITIPQDKQIKLSSILKKELDIGYIDKFKPSVRNNIINVDLKKIKYPNGFIQIPCKSGFQDNKIGITKTPCLRAGNSFTLVQTESGGIRLLTPNEWERLQTVPDNYTYGVSNTQRYKMLGNGFTVDVIAHILRGLKV